MTVLCCVLLGTAAVLQQRSASPLQSAPNQAHEKQPFVAATACSSRACCRYGQCCQQCCCCCCRQ
jgi:hypothetical protein